MPLVIGGLAVNEGRTFIIAEAGSNFGGHLSQAKELIDVAVEAGADAVKFQSYEGDSLVGRNHPAHSILDKYSLPKEWHFELNEYCREKGILFCSTPFDSQRLAWLEEVGVEFHKIASGDLTYVQLVKEIAATGRPIILSTGMATLGEVETAINTIKQAGNDQIVLMHCVGSYPTEVNEVNLRSMQTLAHAFGLPVGFSDHTKNTVIPALAVAMGACVIEKHFTLERDLDTPDHSFALRPSELAEMVTNIRLAEAAMGSKEKRPTQSEVATSRIEGRRSLHAKVDIECGARITADTVRIIRPATGLAPEYCVDVIGKKALTFLRQGDPIRLHDIDWAGE